MNFIAIGKKITTKVHGKINAMSGNNIFTGASIANFSARKKRSLRLWSACARNTGPRFIPIDSACMTAIVKLVTAGSPSRSANARNDSERPYQHGYPRNTRITDCP